MTEETKSGPSRDESRRKITLERTFDAPIEDVWDLWTTQEGIESWWGPDGFAVKVHSIDLRPGGDLSYAMSAVGAPQIEFMKKAGMPVTTEHKITFVEIIAHERLVYTQAADFIPGVESYPVETVVELRATPHGVHMKLTIDAMHDEHWTEMAVKGWESELGRLEKAIAAKVPARSVNSDR